MFSGDEADDFCHNFGTRFPQGSKASGITGNEYVGTASRRLVPYVYLIVPKSATLHNIDVPDVPPEPQGLTVLVLEGIIFR